MEATDVYWEPVWHLLEEQFELVLANAQHIRNVPGRKTDVNDATWIADLLAHRLIRSSFVPPAPIQELRDLTRTRKQLVREISQHSSRIQKILEDAKLKLGSVLSNVLGKSGRAILHALIAGETNPETLADLAEGTARKKRAELIEALRGRIRDHHRKLLKRQEGHSRGGRLHAHCRLSHVENRYPYRDLGADHFSSRDRFKAILRLVRRLNDLGCKVRVTPQAA